MASYHFDPINILDTSNATGVGTGGSMTIGGGISVGRDTYIGGNLAISGTTTSFADNIITLNTNPSGSFDTGFLFGRSADDVSNKNNFSALIYKETTDEFSFGYATADTRGAIAINNYVPIRTGGVNITGGGLNASWDSNTIGNIFTTGGNVGINIANPATNVHIVGNVSVNNNQYVELNVGATEHMIRLQSYSTQSLDTVNKIVFDVWNTDEVGSFYISSYRSGVSSYGNLLFSDYNNVNYMVLDMQFAPNSNIGTINMYAPLNIAANTTIGQYQNRAIKLQSNNTTNRIEFEVVNADEGAAFYISSYTNNASSYGNLKVSDYSNFDYVVLDMQPDGISGTGTVNMYVPLNVSRISTGSISIATGITTASLLATTSISTGQFSATNISSATLNVSTGATMASLRVTELASLTKVTSDSETTGSLIATTGITTGTLLATTGISSGTLNGTNSTITNAVHTTLSSGTLNLSTGLTTASLLATTSISTGLLNVTNLTVTNITGTNVVATALSAGTLNLSTGLTADSLCYNYQLN
jgi:hypothetical protein